MNCTAKNKYTYSQYVHIYMHILNVGTVCVLGIRGYAQWK